MAEPVVGADGLIRKPEYTDFPQQPINVFVVSPYLTGQLDLVWDNPAILPENANFNLAGVNIWRTFDSPEANYEKLNSTPIQVLAYRDGVREIEVTEDVSNSFSSYGTNALGEFIFKVSKPPIIDPGKGGLANSVTPGFGGALGNIPESVKVTIDGVPAKVKTYDSFTGYVTLITSPVFDAPTQKLKQYPYPVPGSVTKVTYTTVSNLVLTALSQRIYYKITSVTVDGKETPLDRVQPQTYQNTDRMNYYWVEAIRRQTWMREQGGERVLLFIRKRMGKGCKHTDPLSQQLYNTSINNCKVCFGTGVVGGYEGPIEIIVAPPESAQSIQLSERGLHLDWVVSTWTGPYPIMNQRDFVVRKNGIRMLVGPVAPIFCTGAILQQEFSLSAIDEGDIIYSVPVVPKPNTGSAYISEKTEVPEERRLKARTRVFQNIVY